MFTRAVVLRGAKRKLSTIPQIIVDNIKIFSIYCVLGIDKARLAAYNGIRRDFRFCAAAGTPCTKANNLSAVRSAGEG